MVTTTTGLATSYINFSRASNATVTNNVGNIAWAGHNLLTNSESFDASAWVKAANVTISANAAVAPNGTTTADTVTLGAGTAAKYIYQTRASLGAQTTVTCCVKLASGTVRYIQLLQNNDVQCYANFDIGGNVTGTKGTNTSSSSITSIGSDWYYISATFAGSGDTPFIQIVDGTSAGYSPSTTATGTFHIWGASLYRSDLGGMVFNPAMPAGMGTYYPTTPYNLVGYTEDFSNGYWSRYLLNVTSNVALAPNGLQTADRITFTGLYAYIGSSVSPITVAGTKATISVWLKLESGNANLQLRGSLNALVYNQDITVTSEWQRFAVTFTHDGSNNIGLAVQDRNTSNWGSVLIWGAQLSDSASIDAYTPVYGAAVTSAAYYAPRLDYSPSPLQPLGLLVEEQRTNLILRSQEFDNASWGKNSIVTPVPADAILAPTGTSVAETITATNATASHYLDQSITWTAVVHTVSVYVKRGTQQFFQITTWDGTTSRYANFDILNGTPGTTNNATSTITPVGDSWYRVTLTTSTAQAAAAGNITFAFASSASSPANPSFATVGTETFYLFGAQVEAGSFSTSYIPTSASQVTRSKDIAGVSTQAFPFITTQGTLVGVFSPLIATNSYPSRSYVVNISDNGNLRFTLRGGDTGINPYFVYGTGSSIVSIGPTSTFSANSIVKVGGTAGTGGGAYYANGTLIGTDAGVLSTSSDELQIGQNNTGSQLNGWIRQITYIPRRISNSDLQTRTI